MMIRKRTTSERMEKQRTTQRNGTVLRLWMRW